MIKLETQNVMQFWVPGKPCAQSRARHTKNGVYSSASKGLKNWRAKLVSEMLRAGRVSGVTQLEGALLVDMVFMLAIKDRRRHGEVCHTKPDKDNLEKAVLDCMAEAQLFAVGDSQVGAGQVVKVWCAPGSEGVHVALKRVRMAKKIPAQGGDNEKVDWLSNIND